MTGRLLVALGCLLAAGLASGQSVPLFAAPVSTLIGTGSFGVAVGDLDGDGQVDVAAFGGYGLNSHTLSILLNQGQGELGTVAMFDFGGDGESLALADFDADGLLDVLVPEYLIDRAAIALNQGAGTFGPYAESEVQSRPDGVAAGDLDGDGLPDAFVTNSHSDSLSVLLGLGAGQVGPAVHSTVGSEPYGVAAADIDGDGQLDVATANFGGSVSVLLGTGSGALASASTTPAGAGLYSLSFGDLDQDGRVDIVSPDLALSEASVLLQLPNGSWSVHAWPAGFQPRSTAVADFDADGRLDVATADSQDDTVSILRGTGTGALLPPLAFAVDEGPSSVAPADLDGDGRIDLVVVNHESSKLTRLFNQNPTLGPWHELGAGLPGSDGLPTLLGNGMLQAGGEGNLDLRHALPGARALLFVSTGSTPIAFKGGTLVAFPFVQALMFFADMNGDVLLPFTWPTGVPTSSQLVFQYAIRDPAAPQGAALSNGLLAITP